MYLKWGTVGGRGKGNGEQGGGEVSIQPTRDLSGWESHHDAKEGFPVSKKGVQGRGQEFLSKGGLSKGLGYALRYHANLVYIVLIVYMSC
jgi:hypothetical protein